VAGYFGLLSFIPGLGVVAIAFSIWAIMDIGRHPKRHGVGRVIVGLAGGILGTLFWGAMLIVHIVGL